MNIILCKGIVLKAEFTSNKLCLFDRNLGKIRCTIKFKNHIITLPNGAYIKYSLYKESNKYQYKIQDINILDLPTWNKKNLFFFHHILELCYYFIPLNYSANIDILFDLILNLYEKNKLIENNLVKKIFLYKFFTILGINPEKNIDFNIKNIDMQINSQLNSWITSCIFSHPNYKYFKTINFLKEIDLQ